jgi:hypothetical protein
MKNEILLIPDKPDIERDSIANTWIENGGEVLRIGKFWEKPNIDSRRVTIYGNDTFSLVLAQVIGVDLILPKDEIISQLDIKWTKRRIDILEISEINDTFFPTFLKPIKPKTFKSKVYEDYECFIEEVKGIEQNELIIRSDIVSIKSEVRAFVLNSEILDLALYEGPGDLSSAKVFLKDFLINCTMELPKTYVVDLGYNDSDKWFIIEFNSSWGAGLNSCNPNKVIKGIREATINL